MPLTHFLMLLLVVIAAAGATLWLASAAGVPLVALVLAALVGAALTRLLTRVE